MKGLFKRKAKKSSSSSQPSTQPQPRPQAQIQPRRHSRHSGRVAGKQEPGESLHAVYSTPGGYPGASAAIALRAATSPTTPDSAFVNVECGLCQTMLRAPPGPQFQCSSCDSINYRSDDEVMQKQLEAAYRSFNWQVMTKRVQCQKCGTNCHLPLNTEMFRCGNCRTIADIDGQPVLGRGLGGGGRGRRLGTGAVVGLTGAMLLTPWLFWSFVYW